MGQSIPKVSLFWVFRDDDRPDQSVGQMIGGPYRTQADAEAWARSFDQPGESSKVQVVQLIGDLVGDRVVPRPPRGGSSTGPNR